MTLFKIADLASLIPNLAVQRLQTSILLVRLILQLYLLVDGLVKAHLQDTQLFLILLGGRLGLLKLRPQLFNEGRILGPRLLLGGVVVDPRDVGHAQI